MAVTAVQRFYNPGVRFICLPRQIKLTQVVAIRAQWEASGRDVFLCTLGNLGVFFNPLPSPNGLNQIFLPWLKTFLQTIVFMVITYWELSRTVNPNFTLHGNDHLLHGRENAAPQVACAFHNVPRQFWKVNHYIIKPSTISWEETTVWNDKKCFNTIIGDFGGNGVPFWSHNWPSGRRVVLITPIFRSPVLWCITCNAFDTSVCWIEITFPSGP